MVRGVRLPARPAASSMASGFPSSPAQSSAISAALSVDSRKSERASIARSTNRETASNCASPSGGTWLPGSGTVRGGTRITTSPLMPSRCRLVARIRSRGHSTRNRCTRSAAASRTRSQPSRTSKASRSATKSAIPPAPRQGPHWPRRHAGRGRLRPWWRRAPGPERGRGRRTSSRRGRRRARPGASRWASRLLPMPPGPIRVTTRSNDSRCLTSASNDRRPTNDVKVGGASIQPA